MAEEMRGEAWSPMQQLAIPREYRSTLKIPAISTALLDVENFIGCDTDSGRTMSTERSHFLWLDTSDRARSSVVINGAGGGKNRVGGIGPLLASVKNWDGEMRFIIATKAVYIEPEMGQPRFSVLGQQRLKEHGLILKQCYHGEVDALICDVAGEIIPLEEANNILVLKVFKHAKMLAAENSISAEGLNAAAVEVGKLNLPPVLTLKQLQEFGKRGRTDAEEVEMALTALLCATCMYAVEVSSLVLNEAKLSEKEKAWLWHWRWGHGDWNGPVRASEDMDEADKLTTVKLNVDCAICDKARFKRGSFPRNDPTLHAADPPFWRCYVDGYGGQESLGGESYDGAIGGYVFYCRSSKTLRNKLYASHKQFPVLLYQFLQDVESQHFRCREIVVDTFSVNISQEAEDVAALFRVKIIPISAGTPQENAFAESGVRVIGEMSRAFMAGAPHLPKKCWGLADNWSCWVRDIKPQKSLGWKSSFEIRTARKPPYHDLFLKIFGAPCNYSPIDGAVHKRGELTEDGWFVGVQWPMVLVMRKSDMKVISVSRKKVHVYEGSYIQQSAADIVNGGLQEIVGDGPFQKLDASNENFLAKNLAKKLAKNNDGKLEAVTSIKSLRGHVLNDQLVNPQVKPTANIQKSAMKSDPNQGEGVHVPEHVRIDMDSFLKDLDRLKAEALKKTSEEGLRSKIIKSIQEVRKAVVNNEITEGHLKIGKKQKKSGIISENILTGKRKRKSVSFVDQASVAEVPSANELPASVHDDELPDRGLLTGKAVKKLIPGDVVSCESVRFDGSIPGSFSNGNPERIHGRVVSKEKNGTYKVKWDDDDDVVLSHWTHLVLEIPKVSVETVLAILGDATELRSRPDDQSGAWPNNFFEALVRSDWRDWVMAVKKENAGWIINQAMREVKYTDMKRGARCIPLGELFSVKRDGRYKFRQIAFGNMLRPGKDFGETFASTVTADGMRWFFALACSANLPIFGWDATVGYLQAKLDIPVYAYLPSHHEYSELPMEDLAVLRTQLLELMSKEGPGGLKKFVAEQRRTARKNPETVLELLKSVYGIPSSGNSFAMLMRSTHVEKCGVHQTESDPSIYIKIVCEEKEDKGETSDSVLDPADKRSVECIGENGTTKVHCVDGTVVEFLVIIVWTDDVRYFGTDELRLQYEKDIKANLRVDFEGKTNSFVSCDYKQNFEAKTLEVTQSKYWEKCVEKYKHLWPDGVPKHRGVPISPTDAAYMLEPVTDEEFNLAKGLEFPNLLGQIQYPTVYTKLEMRFCVSLISRQRSKWSRRGFQILVKALEYGYATRDIGLMYSCGLDKHGVNKLYAYADSNFAAPRSQGCRMTMMNGCMVSCTSKRHTTTDTSTTEAEATEFFLGTRDVERLRNLMAEVGLFQQEATVIYQDNMPAIQIMTNRGSLPNKSKAMDIRVMSARNKVEDGKVLPVYVKTLGMLADIGTKALDEKQFVFLRDLANGYALVRASGGVVDLPSLVISAMELKV
jgi:hypothetical protein